MPYEEFIDTEHPIFQKGTGQSQPKQSQPLSPEEEGANRLREYGTAITKPSPLEDARRVMLEKGTPVQDSTVKNK